MYDAAPKLRTKTLMAIQKRFIPIELGGQL
jgi:hypothetical protein